MPPVVGTLAQCAFLSCLLPGFLPSELPGFLQVLPAVVFLFLLPQQASVATCGDVAAVRCQLLLFVVVQLAVLQLLVVAVAERVVLPPAFASVRPVVAEHVVLQPPFASVRPVVAEVFVRQAEPFASLQAVSPAVPTFLLLLVLPFLSLVAVLVAATVLVFSAVPSSLFVVVLETVAVAVSVVLLTCDVVLQVSLVLLVALAGAVPFVPLGTAAASLLVSAVNAHVALQFGLVFPPAVVSLQHFPLSLFLCVVLEFFLGAAQQLPFLDLPSQQEWLAAVASALLA